MVDGPKRSFADVRNEAELRNEMANSPADAHSVSPARRALRVHEQ